VKSVVLYGAIVWVFSALRLMVQFTAQHENHSLPDPVPLLLGGPRRPRPGEV